MSHNRFNMAFQNAGLATDFGFKLFCIIIARKESASLEAVVKSMSSFNNLMCIIFELKSILLP